MRTVALLLLVSLAAVATAHRGHRNKVLRRTTPVVTAIDEKSKVHNVFGAFSKKMGDLYMLKEGHGDDVLQMPQGMSVPLQDPDDLVTPLVEKLDKKCGERFTQTLHGEAKSMHTLDLASKSLKKDCEKKYEGKLCATKATIHTNHKDSGTQNDVVARFEMDGDSCIPEECVSSNNLAALAEFMRGRAVTMGEEMGNDLEIALNVDCSDEEVLGEAGGKIVSPQPKSAAAQSVAPAMTLLVAAASLVALA